MVVLEAAAIGAVGYGLYRGGDAAVRKGKETHKEIQREGKRWSQRSELNSKTKDRKQRIAELANARESAKAASSRGLPTTTTAANTSSTSLFASSTSSLPSMTSSSRSGTSAGTDHTASNSSLEDRMAKLRANHVTNTTNNNKKKGGNRLTNMFKRK